MQVRTKILAILPLVLAICCVITVAGFLAYNKVFAYRDERDFFSENRAIFHEIIAIAETSKDREFGCNDILVSDNIASKVGYEYIWVCYDNQSEVSFISATNPYGGRSFCYLPSEPESLNGFFVGNSPYRGSHHYTLDGEWHLCTLSID